MFKLLLILAYLVIARALPIEQHEDSNLKPASDQPTAQLLIDPVSLPTLTESEESVPSFEPEKHEESVVEEPNEGKVPAKIEISVPSPESGNRERPIVSEVSEQRIPEPIESNPILTDQWLIDPVSFPTPTESESSVPSFEPEKHEELVVEEPNEGKVPAKIEISVPSPESGNRERPIVSEQRVPESIESNPILTDQWLIDPVSFPTPTESESSVPSFEPKKHEVSVIEEPNERKVPEKIEISVSSPESGNREKPIVSEQRIPEPIKPVVSEQPIVSEPMVSEQPIVSIPIISEPIVSEPIVSEPIVSEQPIVSKPIISEPIVSVPIVSEPIVSEQPIVSKPIISEPMVSEKPIISKPIISEPIVSEPISESIDGPSPAVTEISTLDPETEKHKEPEIIKSIYCILKPEGTVPSSASANQKEDEKQLEAALDEFFKFLNLSESEEMEDEVIGSILLEMFEGLDELINALELMAESTDQREDSAILLKQINNPLMTNIFLSKPAPSPETPISVNHQKLNKENEAPANEEDSPTAACKNERGLPGICVPYYLCATTGEHDKHVVSVNVDSSTCRTVLEVCCSSENLQLGTGAGLRKWK